MQRLCSHKSLLDLFLVVLVITVALAGCSTPPASSVRIEAEPNSTRPGTININLASAEELESLPNLGAVLARRIVEHRDRYGPFRKPAHLLLVDGISEKRYREIKQFIDTR